MAFAFATATTPLAITSKLRIMMEPGSEDFRTSGLTGAGAGAAACCARYTHVAAGGSPASCGTSNFGLLRCACGDTRGSRWAEFLRTGRMALPRYRAGMLDKIDQLIVILGGAAPRRIFPDRLVAGRRIVQVDALTDTGAKNAITHDAVAAEGFQCGSCRVRSAVDKRG